MKSVACTIGAGTTANSNFSSPAPQKQITNMSPMPSPIVPGIRGVGQGPAKEPGYYWHYEGPALPAYLRTVTMFDVFLVTWIQQLIGFFFFFFSYPFNCLLSVSISKMVVSLHDAFEHGRQWDKSRAAWPQRTCIQLQRHAKSLFVRSVCTHACTVS